jgi:hypothetical protein
MLAGELENVQRRVMEFVVYCLDEPDGADARRRARTAHLRL